MRKVVKYIFVSKQGTIGPGTMVSLVLANTYISGNVLHNSVDIVAGNS